MRRHSVEDRYSLFYQTAAISAHANAGGKGFRQRDFVFMLDLMLNWAAPSNSLELRLHNAQAQRFLEQLVESGFAKKGQQGRLPQYRLTRLGLLELVSLMMKKGGQLEPSEFYFLFYFVSSYRSRIEELIGKEGSQFPAALRLEILALLDAEGLLRQELARCEREIEKVDIRIRETHAGARLYEEQRRSGKSIVDAAKVLEKRYPYQLNSQKPLSKLIGEIPPDISEEELTTGAKRRVEFLFQPARQNLLRHRENLRQLMR